MNYSTNYNMNKPQPADQYNIDHWNQNTDIIDTAMKANADAIVTENERAVNAETALQNLTNQTFKTALLNFCYPIGSLYWSSNSANPSTLFGGTWVQIKDAMIYAKSDSDTVDNHPATDTPHGSNTRTANDLPKHNHQNSLSVASKTLTGSFTVDSYSSIESASGIVSRSNNTTYYLTSYSKTSTEYQTATITATHDHTLSGSIGSNYKADGSTVQTATDMDIRPKHLFKYCWERTA